MKYTPEKDALEKRIREMAEPLKIPPSLAPENLMSRLPDRQQTPIIRIRRYLPAAAAAACLLVVLSGTIFLREFSADPMITADDPVSNSSTGGSDSSTQSWEEESQPASSSEASAESVPENSEPDLSSETPVSTDTNSSSPVSQTSGNSSQTTSNTGSSESASQPQEESSSPSSEPEGNLQQQDITAYQSVFETMMAFRQSDTVYQNGGLGVSNSSSNVSVKLAGTGTGAQTVQKNSDVICTLSSNAEADIVTIYSTLSKSASPTYSFQPEYILPEFEGMHFSSISFTGLYLERNMLSVVGTAYYWSDTGIQQRALTVLVSYDISNPQKPKYCSTLAQDGKLTASYDDDGRLALITTYEVSPQQKLSEDQVSSYIPVCYVEGKELLPTHEQLQISKEADTPTYTFISLVNLVRPNDFQDIFSYLGQGDTFYLDEGQIYMARSGPSKTRLTSFSYTSSRIRMDAETIVDGVMMGDFSTNPNGRSLRVSVATSQNSVTLYLLNPKLEVLGQMDNFIPADTVSSVWYHGYFAYYLDARGNFLCTVDCSMPKFPEFLDEIPQDMGDFGEYYEFGSQTLKITPAYGADGTQTGLKLILYRENSPFGFEEIHSTLMEGSINMLGWGEPESLYLDAQNELIGFSVVQYGETTQIRYVLFSYKKSSGFTKLLDIPIETGNNQYLDYRTGYYDAGTFYLATPDQILTFDVNELKKNTAQ